eukprot:TRINITY_DN21_c0_g3_i1.p1 TRINITY_DN21_c0_g3~~TRINITY_DN21_c0_g3_i1.p1  ORF type:complete len:806 (+),score=359.85 TRINITY_DN21_c0_g3_i1:94-2511(+)
MTNGSDATAIIFAAGFTGLLFALIQFSFLARVKLHAEGALLANDDGEGARSPHETLGVIYEAVRKGANAFLFSEYSLCFGFIVVFGTIVLVLTSHTSDGWDWTVGGLTACSFAVGGLTSILSGYIGMSVATFGNARCTLAAADNQGAARWRAAFNAAFRAGGVMGFSLCGLALLVLFFLIGTFKTKFDYAHPTLFTNVTVGTKTHQQYFAFEECRKLFECIAGFGLGGSCIALFGRVGGGIYTKAADVGADLAGKVVAGIPEDDPRNPATIADNVGDNVGDVAGMGSDLFGSFAEASCAALVVSATSTELVMHGWQALMYPLLVSAVGIFVCLVTSFIATHVQTVAEAKDVEKVLKVQLAVTAVLMIAVVYPISYYFLPSEFHFSNHLKSECDVKTDGLDCREVVHYWYAWLCVSSGLVAGCLIGFITEYYTSHSYTPVREVADSCKTGAATNIIYGLALGYKSAILPIVLIAGATFLSFSLAGMYGVALAALGMLGTLATCLSIDVYGPVCDNAGGMAEMAEFPEEVRDVTDALDAAGNTTAAIGKGFAIGSAALVSLALFGGFLSRVGTHGDIAIIGNNAQGFPEAQRVKIVIDVLRPATFAFLFLGAMLPYAFTALTMKSVGIAAKAMVEEVVDQFKTKRGLLEGAPGHEAPDHARCIQIATDASLREAVLPGLMVILSPILTGVLFGVEAVSGLLVGALTSGVQLAISQSNTGGAWDNAKKYVEGGQISNEAGEVQGKGTDLHKAAVIGDTVGDPLKDTSGPALNIVMKLTAIISLVFADFFVSINHGKGAFKIASAIQLR